MKVRNLQAFTKGLRDFADQTVPEEATKLHRFVALDLIRRVTYRSPVDTGRFRSAWAVSLSKPDPRPVSAGGAPILGAGQVISNALSELEQLRPYSICWVHNSLPYATAIENGHSGQAPSGVLAISVAEVEAGFSRGDATP